MRTVNLMVIGVQTKDFFTPDFFNDYAILARDIDSVPSVENVLSIPGAITLVKDTITQKLKVSPLAGDKTLSNVDNFKQVFLSLLFYKNFLYNPETGAYVMAVRIEKTCLIPKNEPV